jgi:hypothetical protein
MRVGIDSGAAPTKDPRDTEGFSKLPVITSAVLSLASHLGKPEAERAPNA